MKTLAPFGNRRLLASSAYFPYKSFQLRYDAIEFLDKETVAPLAEDRDKLPVVPECAVLAAVETSPYRLAVAAEVRKDGAGVVQLVGGGHAKDLRAGSAQMFEILHLPLEPGRLRVLVRVRAAVHDLDHLVAEAAADLLPCRISALILDGVVQESSDGFVLADAILQDEGGNGEKVRDVGDRSYLPLLVGVKMHSIPNRSFPDERHRGLGCDSKE